VSPHSADFEVVYNSVDVANNTTRLLRPLEKTAAQAFGEPCCDWVGESGSGHYVKMVHNGIEYGDMQLIAEAYDILTRGLGLSAGEIADIFEKVRSRAGGYTSSRNLC